MQINVGLLLLAGCGAALFFMLLGIFIFSKLHYFTRRFFLMGIINSLMGQAKDEIENDAPLPARRRTSSPTTDVRAQTAQSLDFDAAVAKYSQPGNTTNFSAQNAAPPLPPPPSLKLSNRPSLDDYDRPPGLRRRRRDDHDIDVDPLLDDDDF